MTNVLPPVLDACCGAKMFWFDKSDPRAVFLDNRSESLVCDTRQGRREITVSPDVVGDFRSLPYADGSFHVVVFDPPHTFSGASGWTGKKYGTLTAQWKDDIRAGFAECFRVLKRNGVLIFKWNEHRISVARVLELTEEKPLLGQRCGATARTHWIVFIKRGGM